MPERFRPLPGRPNIVITRQPEWTSPGALCAHDIQGALELCTGSPDAWVIGGSEVYALAEPMAHSAVITEIELEAQGDAFAPTFGSAWKEASRERQTAKNGTHFSIVKLIKN